MLCVPIKKACFKSIALANQKADLIEFRLDLFTPSNLKVLRNFCQKPVIFKLNHLDSNSLNAAPDYIDLPFGTAPCIFNQIPRSIKSICSFHNQEKTPDLLSIYKQMQKYCATHYKIATLAQSTLDSLKMLQLVKATKCIGVCMGEKGSVTRILSPVFGAPWTYAPLNKEQQTASGQLPLDELVHTYRYRFLNTKTAIYGLIGDPLDTSVGHQVHNRAFAQMGIDGVYVKIPTNKAEVSSCLSLGEQLGFQGLSVTMPLKEYIQKGEVINTIRFKRGNRYYWNTDGRGALDVVEKKMRVRGRRLLILGAGGAASAIALEAKKRGALLFIANRTKKTAQKLAAAVDAEVLSLRHFASCDYDILINCTPTCPITCHDLLDQRIVMDIIVRDQLTPLLKSAQTKQCVLIEGIEMFIQQAVGQYCHWFNTLPET